MVKETKFGHFPVRITKGLALGTEEEFGSIIQLDFQTANIAAVVSTNSTVWKTLDLSAYAPTNARAAILDVAARDAGGVGTDAFIQFGYPGFIESTKTQIVYCGDVADRWQSRLVIATLNELDQVNIRVTASAGVFDYTIKLIGWLIDPYVAKVALPYVDLKAIFSVTN